MTEKKLTEDYFNELFNLHYEELCRVALPILKDRAAVEDVVQDVFVKLWLRREEVEVTTVYKAYLYKSVVFRAFDYLRKQKTTGRVKEELKIIHNQSQQEADSSLEEKELIQAIEEGLARLPENTRTIFHLSRFTQLKNREIAEQLNISIKTVESNVTKALKLLNEYIRPFVKNNTLKMLWWLTWGYLLNG